MSGLLPSHEAGAGPARLAGPLVVRASGPGPGKTRWALEHREHLREILTEHGALLIRGLNLSATSEIAQVFADLGRQLMADQEPVAVRHLYTRAVYSSRRWSANDPVDLHHESSYTFEIPTLLMYACRVAPTTGGATLLADAAAVLEALPTSIVDRFEREGWILTRNYHRGLGPSLEDTFSTNNPTDIENYCRANAINHEWATDGALRTQQRLPAVMCHPITGKRCWFNQIAFLNESSLDPEVHDYLLELYTREGLSFNTCYGNGEPIGAKVINLITTAYQHSTIAVPWLAGDLLLIDNIRTAHGRDPYHGPRELLVAMAEPLRSQPDP